MVQKYDSVDKESLIETIEILSDSQTLREIEQGIKDIKAGRYVKLE